jgi:hypothetical protein
MLFKKVVIMNCNKCNIGAIDRVFRLIAAAILIVIGYLFESWIALLAIPPLLSALFAYCPYYLIFKLDTRLSTPKSCA